MAAMDRAGVRGPGAGNDFCTQKSSSGMDAVRARVKAIKAEAGKLGVPISDELAHLCAEDALKVWEDIVLNELFVTERCYAMVCQGHGAARSMAWFSPTAWARILPLIKQLAAAGYLRYKRLLERLDRIVGHCVAAKVFGMVEAGARNEPCVLSGLWMVLLEGRADFYSGSSLERVEAVLRKCKETLHCTYTAIITERLLDHRIVDLTDHFQDFEDAHGEIYRRAQAVIAPLLAKQLVLVDVVFVLDVRYVNTWQDGQTPLLAVFAGKINARLMGSIGAIGMASSEFGAFVLGAELAHLGLDSRRPAGFASDAHWLLYRVQLNLGSNASLSREGSHTFDHTLGFRAADGPQSVTYLGMQVQVLWPASGRAAFTRLRNARRGPYGFVDMCNPDALRAFFELQRDEATEHSGSQEPAKILAKPEREWRSL